MDVNILREVVTVASFATFIGVVWYAVHPRNGKRFEEAAALPFDEEGPSPEPSPRGEGPDVGKRFRESGA